MLGMITTRELCQISKAFVFEHVNQSHARRIERVYSHLFDEAVHGGTPPAHLERRAPAPTCAAREKAVGWAGNSAK